MKKKIVSVTLVVLIICGLFCACVSDGDKIPRKDTKMISGGGGVITVITDEKTGVEYLIYANSYQGGICPRYNADGTLCVSGGSDNG